MYFHWIGSLDVCTDQIINIALEGLLAGATYFADWKYEYSEARGHWKSTAWQGDAIDAAPPQNWVAPLLTWFRGANAAVTQYHDRLVGDATIELERKK